MDLAIDVDIQASLVFLYLGASLLFYHSHMAFAEAGTETHLNYNSSGFPSMILVHVNLKWFIYCLVKNKIVAFAHAIMW